MYSERRKKMYTFTFRTSEQIKRELDVIIQIEQNKVSKCVKITKSDMIQSAIDTLFNELNDNGEVTEEQLNYVYNLSSR